MTVTNILVATDGSDNGGIAVAWAADLAAATGVPVTAVHVFEPLRHLDGPAPIDLPGLRDRAAADLAGPWTRALADAGVTFDTMVIEGRPAEAIADAAERVGADLIVVGARGLSLLRRVALGSTSQQLPHLSSIPTVVVPLPRQD